MDTLIQSSTSFLARQESGKFDHITESEVDQLIAEAPTRQTRLVLRMLWATGARITEISAICAGDVDIKKAVVKIRRIKRRKKFIQTLPIPTDLSGELFLWIRSEKLKPRSKLFRCDRKSFYRSVRALGEKVLSRKISPKLFRHGKAYKMVSKGTHPLIVSRALGHANLTSALAYYHPTEADLREAME